MPCEQWEQAREEISITVGRPLDPQVGLEQLQADQEAAVRALQQAIDRHAGVRIESGKVIADPVEKLWLPPEVVWLDDQIEQRIPLFELVDPLIDVNGWIGFAEHFVHAGGARRRMPDFLPRLFARSPMRPTSGCTGSPPNRGTGKKRVTRRKRRIAQARLAGPAAAVRSRLGSGSMSGVELSRLLGAASARSSAQRPTLVRFRAFSQLSRSLVCRT